MYWPAASSDDRRILGVDAEGSIVRQLTSPCAQTPANQRLPDALSTLQWKEKGICDQNHIAIATGLLPFSPVLRVSSEPSVIAWLRVRGSQSEWRLRWDAGVTMDR